MECALCKVGTTKKGTMTVTLERDRAEETARAIMRTGNDAVEKGAELEVVKLKVA